LFVCRCISDRELIILKLTKQAVSLCCFRTAFVWNLLDNAAKYSPDGTPITLVLSTKADKLHITVRDRGPGIPPQEHRAVSHKFYRGVRARESGVKGTGIGLARCSIPNPSRVYQRFPIRCFQFPCWS
jgi:light-regulated signal transduction histidine kinase (bacteriophytochrome)